MHKSGASAVPDHSRWPRRIGVGLLAIGLLLLGVYDEQLQALLARAWHAVFELLSFEQAAGAIARSAQRQGAHRPSLPGATYMGLYIGICLLILRLLVRTAGEWRLVWRVYAGIAGAYLLLVLLSKAGGDLRWAYRLSRHLLNFLVSPLPVLALLVLLRGSRQAVPASAA